MRKNKLIITFVTVLGIIISFSGITYAYLRSRAVQTNVNNVAVIDCLSISFTSEKDDINLTNAYSITDDVGKTLIPYKFTVKNNCPNGILANINLESLNLDKVSSENYLKNYLSDSYIKVKLNSDNDDINVMGLLSDFPLSETILDNAQTSHTLKSITLDTNAEKSFELRLWIDENVTWEQGKNKKYTAKIVVSGTPLPDITLAGMIRLLYPNIETSITTPGSAVSTSDEALLAATEDDYGTSYYFRGTVKNNYVEFANKCWRIVRITGNGAIKLVLHNDNVNNAASPCDAINNDETAAFARYDGTTYVSKFNASRDKNAYVGFMYGTPGSSTDALEHENKNDSTILTNLKKWYDLTFNKEQKSKLADVIWCNDKNVLTDTSYNPWNMSIGLNFGVGTNKNYYNAASRIISSNNSAGGFGPTLVCSIDNLGGNLSKYTAEDVVNDNGTLKGYKVGLLTADEMVFAGSSLKLSNSSYYLYENASDTLWWTLSPWAYDGVSLYLFASFPDGSLDGSYANTEFGVRPSIALIPSIQISGGTGTSSDPFIIIEN